MNPTGCREVGVVKRSMSALFWMQLPLKFRSHGAIFSGTCLEIQTDGTYCTKENTYSAMYMHVELCIFVIITRNKLKSISGTVSNETAAPINFFSNLEGLRVDNLLPKVNHCS